MADTDAADRYDSAGRSAAELRSVHPASWLGLLSSAGRIVKFPGQNFNARACYENPFEAGRLGFLTALRFCAHGPLCSGREVYRLGPRQSEGFQIGMFRKATISQPSPRSARTCVTRECRIGSCRPLAFASGSTSYHVHSWVMMATASPIICVVPYAHLRGPRSEGKRSLNSRRYQAAIA